MQLTLTAVSHVPDVQPGDDLGSLLLDALAQSDIRLQDGDVLAIAQKIVSKAEGRLVDLASIIPDAEAERVARATAKDPRLVTLILQESTGISRLKPGVLVTHHRLGFTSANAGIDHSNVGGGAEQVLLLPEDPDATAVALRAYIRAETGVDDVGLVITDSHGRPFRLGTVGVAIGVAGLPALWDRRGERDRYGRILQHTEVGLADEIAAAAGLLMGQAAEGVPVVHVRGLNLPAEDGRAADLNRPPEQDLYR